MWLIDHGIDVRCVRMKPYRMSDNTLLLDVQQIIPLPEAAAFQTQIGVKKQAERQSWAGRHDLRLRFWEGLLEYAKTKTDIHANRKPTQAGWVTSGIGRPGFALNYAVRRTDSQVELWIDLGSGRRNRNKAAFHGLKAQKSAIEADFGGELEWQELPDREGCRICHVVDGGYKSPSDQWPDIHAKLVESMIHLDKALRARVAVLNINGPPKEPECPRLDGQSDRRAGDAGSD